MRHNPLPRPVAQGAVSAVRWRLWVRSALLFVLSGLLTVVFHGFALAPVGGPGAAWAGDRPMLVEASQFGPMQPANLLDRAVYQNLQAAKATLLASGAKASELKTFVAKMSTAETVPVRANSGAWGTVGAVLSGNRLVVRGSFRELSSPLRNYVTDPVSPPNPNITSAFHIHRGMATENGPFQYALQVMTDDSGLLGSAMGDYMLTVEQLDALSKGMLYVDLHTTKNRGGELRAVLKPL
ncbi:CHRD domain-containing protein [Limnothrix sp. FACHB-708]|uniref:CHRD domain-containing protein n=1 Tax=unclassified Limnothrix TaxID=2632864 RepID=UPI00168453EA|nr:MULTISPECIES: CHRD domain-containing protein [unclassified Limnothrix]MBD2551692.1 CHRD domain-containing protein [Limnothrix sp. FACHB-708]MBD2591343.1 CHRD domain-containing protein [Limnothrix sp. FACHB-406]